MEKNIKNILLKVSLGVVGVVIIALCIMAFGFYMNYVELKEIGDNFISVFFKNFSTQIVVQLIAFVITFFILFVNLYIVKRTMLKIDVSFDFLKKNIPIILLAFVFSIFASGYIKETVYSEYLKFRNSVNFGVADPVFNRDLSYYVFIRPFVMSLFDSLIGVNIFSTLFICVSYVLLYGKLGIFSIMDIVKQKGICVHVVVNFAMILLIRALSYKFRAEDILYSSFNDLAGAGYTQVNVWHKFYLVAPFLLIILAFLAIIFIYNNRIKSFVISIAVYPTIFICVFATSLFVQYFVVEPTEVQTEEPYIKRNIEFTKMAYGLDQINQQEFSASATLSKEDVAENPETLENIRIIDFNSTQTIISQLQTLRNYYEFKDLDIAAAKIDGKKTPVATSVREMKKDRDSVTKKNYINDKLKFTHGYGLVSMPINKVSPEGQPMFFVQDIPLMVKDGVAPITQPRIYYGEYKDEYSIVNTTIKEFDYEDIETVYDGKSGIQLNFLNKLLFAIKNHDYQILVSNFITDDSKILINKNVVERVEKVVPFLEVDDDPYSIVDKDGKIKWVVDCYTTTDKIPYSQEYKGINYIRNSAKAVVDAYDGTVQIYITDEKDAIIKTYQKIYPSVFTNGPIPEDLKYSIKYSENYFKIQAEMLKRYHTSDTTTFYNKSDVWDVASEMHEDEAKRPIDPYYNMMKLEGTDSANLVLMLPFTISEKDNMVSWLSVGSDGDSYGKMTLYTFPQGKNVYGPLQMEKRFNSNKEITREMTLWGQVNSQVIRGNMLVIPVADSLIYVEPVYITSDKNSFPELKMILASYGEKIVMQPTLEMALEALFSDLPETKGEVVQEPTENEIPNENTPQTPTVPLPDGQIDLNIKEAYKKVQEATANNDWVAFGTAMQELEQAINQLPPQSEE